MEEKETDLYETKTNLYSCGDVVSYLWKKCDKFSFPFKPENSDRFEDQVTFSDNLSGEIIKREYRLKGEDIKTISLKNHEDYDVDNMTFTTLDKDNNVLSKGELVVIYKPYEKYFFVFLKENEESDLKLLVKCIQKKKLFDTYRTETITCF